MTPEPSKSTISRQNPLSLPLPFPPFQMSTWPGAGGKSRAKDRLCQAKGTSIGRRGDGYRKLLHNRQVVDRSSHGAELLLEVSELIY